MAHLTIDINDSASMADQLGSATDVARQTYTVTATSGLFKGGKQYKQGSTIELTAATATNFLKAHEIKESQL